MLLCKELGRLHRIHTKFNREYINNRKKNERTEWTLE